MHEVETEPTLKNAKCAENSNKSKQNKKYHYGYYRKLDFVL